jgi:hypothetical protein
LVHLRPREGGWHTVAHGAAAHRERRRRLRRPEEEEGGRQVGHGPEWPGGPNASWAGVERKKMKKVGWAARMTGPKWKTDFGFDFPNFISRI